MERTTFKNIYPIHTLTIKKSACKHQSVDAILKYLKTKIDAHPVCTYIGEFNHYKHTKELKEGKIDEAMKDAKNILFCFGKELVNPNVLAVRPRSIGVAQMEDSFVLSFLKAPNDAANEAMIAWVDALEA